MVPNAGRLLVTLLGVPSLSWDGARVTPPTRKGTALLCYLAVRAEPIERAALADLLWTGSGSALANLRWELHQLRQLPGASHWLRTDSAAGMLEVRAVTDLSEFEQAVTRGEFAYALQLYGANEQQLMAGPAPRGALGLTEWLDAERDRLASLLRAACHGRALQLEAEADLTAAQELTAQALRLDPLDEEAHRTAIRLALRQGDLAAAAAQFETCRRLLARELGLSPMPETLELAAAVERAAAAPPPAAAAVRRIPPELLRPPELVGREREWAQLQAAWDRRQLIFVSGQPGVGKTRLVQDFIRSKVGDDVAVLRGCPGDQLVPFSGYARGWRGVYEARPELKEELPRWVRTEAARFLPELFGERPDAGAAAADLRFASALRELYLQLLTSFGAALVDDIQYFDPASWRLGGGSLVDLFTDPARSGSLGRMINCFRTDEMPASFLTGLSSLVAAGVAAHVEVAPLDAEATARLLVSLGLPSAEAQTRQLERLTGGNPLIVLELLRKLAESGALDEAAELPLEAVTGDRLPESVHQLIWRRLERLPSAPLRAAQALAVLQEAATPARMAEMLEGSEAGTVEQLVALERAQVTNGMAFSHDLLQETVARSLPEPLARLLHGRAARLLEREGAPAALTAHHWWRAGEEGRALAHYLTAAEEAHASGASENATVWLERVLQHAEGEVRRRALEVSGRIGA